MIVVNDRLCPQNHACPAIASCPEGAIVQDGIYSAPRRPRSVHRVRGLHERLPRVLTGAG